MREETLDIGRQRDWVWRGWQIRYTYLRGKGEGNPPMVLIHGFGAAIAHWRHNLPILRETQLICPNR